MVSEGAEGPMQSRWRAARRAPLAPQTATVGAELGAGKASDNVMVWAQLSALELALVMSAAVMGPYTIALSPVLDFGSV